MEQSRSANFIGRRSAKQLKALDTAVAIATVKHGVDAVMRVVCSSVAPAIREHLRRSGFLCKFRKGELRLSSRPNLYRLAGVKQPRDSAGRWPDDIGVDHSEMWNLNGEPALFAYHPYDLHLDQLTHLTAFCKMHRLGLFLTAYSPYFPTRNLMVVIYKRAKR